MFCSSNAPRPPSVIVKPPRPFDFTKPNAPSLLAIFIGIDGGSRVASVAASISRSQSKSSRVRFGSMTTIPFQGDIPIYGSLRPSACNPLKLNSAQYVYCPCSACRGIEAPAITRASIVFHGRLHALRLPRTQQASPEPLRARPGAACLGQSAGSVPPIWRRCARRAAACCGRPKDALQRTAPRPHACIARFRPRFDWDAVRAVAGPLRLEGLRRNLLGAALQSLERQSPSHRRLFGDGWCAWPCERCLSLRELRSRARAPWGMGPAGRASRPSDWAREHYLARSLEIRHAGVSLLPARLRPCHCRGELRRIRARLALAPARRARRRGDRGAARARSQRSLGRNGGARLPVVDLRRRVAAGRTPPHSVSLAWQGSPVEFRSRR